MFIKKDLEVILEAASGWEFADENRIVLPGTSQGGITSAITAAKRPDRISGLVLMYPAFLVGDAVHEQFDSLEEVRFLILSLLIASSADGSPTAVTVQGLSLSPSGKRRSETGGNGRRFFRIRFDTRRKIGGTIL